MKHTVVIKLEIRFGSLLFPKHLKRAFKIFDFIV